MPPNLNNLKKLIIIGLILVLLAFIGSFIFNYYYLAGKIASLNNTPLATPSSPPAQKIVLPKVIYNLTGKIQKIDTSSLTLEANIPQTGESNQPAKKTEIKKILLTAQTKFSQLSFIATAGSSQKTPTEKTITLKDLKIGDSVEVIANHDISGKEVFEATQVRILPTSF